MAATELAAKLRPNRPATGRILILRDSVEAAQAVWLAGVVEPRSIGSSVNVLSPEASTEREGA